MSACIRTARIRTVEPLAGFVLRLGFDDGIFGQVRVDEKLGTIVWPNGADLDPEVLYRGAAQAPRG